MSETIDAFRLKKDTMGGASWEYTVYTTMSVAEAVARQKHEEWVNYEVHPVKVRVLSQSDGVIGHDLVNIDRTTEEEWLRASGLKKLTVAERKALGL